MKDGMRKKTVDIPEDLAHYIRELAFRSRGRINHSQIVAKAIAEYKERHPLPPS